MTSRYSSTVLTTYRATTKQKESQKGKNIDRRRDRTCNLLIRSQAPCHWASRPVKILIPFCYMGQRTFLGKAPLKKSALGVLCRFQRSFSRPRVVGISDQLNFKW
ncbi:hypothetical protein ACN38_g9124 [Penicillium nordicum]|uniref:Uncharacterized protein n=1 Tax=Penicillium nordicum TaxID=229535 RepID=A0A0M8P2K5_9EURO|nr:hypothetical protein ACN38_g9124 [Penicillium nordicum]